MMTEEQFESLWERAEAERFGRQLSLRYPAWRQHRRRRMAIGTMAVAIGLGVGIPLLTGSGADDYERVYCNRSGIADSQWADLASDLLLMS